MVVLRHPTWPHLPGTPLPSFFYLWIYSIPPLFLSALELPPPFFHPTPLKIFSRSVHCCTSHCPVQFILSSTIYAVQYNLFCPTFFKIDWWSRRMTMR